MCFEICVLGCMCLGMCICIFRCVLGGVLQNGPWLVFIWVVVVACGSMAKVPKYRNSVTCLSMLFPIRLGARGRILKPFASL